MYRFGRGYTLQVKIKLPDGSTSRPVNAAGSKKSLRSKSRSSTLVSSSATRIPTDGSDPLVNATKNFHNFVYETFQDVTLVEEHQVKSNYLVTNVYDHVCTGCYHLSA